MAEELSIPTSGTNRKASLTNSHHLPMVKLVSEGVLTIGICSRISNMHGGTRHITKLENFPQISLESII